MKAQTMIIVLLLVVIIFGGLLVFLLSAAKTVVQNEYMNIYTSNLLLSLMRKDTGYTDADCKTISDLVFCRFNVHQNPYCGDRLCSELAESILNETLREFEAIKSGYEYFLTAKPQGNWNPVTPEGIPITLKIGNEKVEKSREKFVAMEIIQKADMGGLRVLKIILYVAKSKQP